MRKTIDKILSLIWLLASPIAAAIAWQVMDFGEFSVGCGVTFFVLWAFVGGIIYTEGSSPS